MEFIENTDAVVKVIGGARVVPVVKIDDASMAVPLANAILEGGLNIVEITFRTQAAASAIKNITENVSEMFVGAGTVLNPTLAKNALDAGAKFIVSPGLNPSTVDFAKQNSLPVIPGVATPSDIELALMMNLTTLKLFPASTLGGTDFLKAMAGPFGNVKFLPTGGVNQDNFMSYLSQKNVLAVGGSWMVKSDLVKECRWGEITKLVRELVDRMNGTAVV